MNNNNNNNNNNKFVYNNFTNYKQNNQTKVTNITPGNTYFTQNNIRVTTTKEEDYINNTNPQLLKEEEIKKEILQYINKSPIEFIQSLFENKYLLTIQTIKYLKKIINHENMNNIFCNIQIDENTKTITQNKLKESCNIWKNNPTYISIIINILLFVKYCPITCIISDVVPSSCASYQSDLSHPSHPSHNISLSSTSFTSPYLALNHNCCNMINCHCDSSSPLKCCEKCCFSTLSLHAKDFFYSIHSNHHHINNAIHNLSPLNLEGVKMRTFCPIFTILLYKEDNTNIKRNENNNSSNNIISNNNSIINGINTTNNNMDIVAKKQKIYFTMSLCIEYIKTKIGSMIEIKGNKIEVPQHYKEFILEYLFTLNK